MDIRKESALKIAEFLLQIKAVKLQPGNPFTWASGWISPIYCDNRKTLSFPHIRTYIRQQMVKAIEKQYGKPDAIVGVATGGIPQGVLVAQDMGLAFAYVRPEPKAHGTASQVEGVLEPGQSVVLVEDLISTGGSSLKAVETLRNYKIKVKGMAAVFNYGFDKAAENLKLAQVDLISLCDYNILITQALKSGYISEKDIETLEAWRKKPETWGQK